LEFLPDVINDLDVDFSDNPAAAAAYKNDQRNIRKVKEATNKLKVNIIHPLREGKKLLVLDIDYSRLPPSSCSK
jgi:ubiquitin-like domain-containing CTD phosphatase 1